MDMDSILKQIKQESREKALSNGQKSNHLYNQESFLKLFHLYYLSKSVSSIIPYLLFILISSASITHHTLIQP